MMLLEATKSNEAKKKRLILVNQVNQCNYLEVLLESSRVLYYTHYPNALFYINLRSNHFTKMLGKNFFTM